MVLDVLLSFKQKETRAHSSCIEETFKGNKNAVLHDRFRYVYLHLSLK